jgi:hypothetical protein
MCVGIMERVFHFRSTALMFYDKLVPTYAIKLYMRSGEINPLIIR